MAEYWPRFTSKLIGEIWKNSDHKCDRVAILDPYSFEVKAVVSRGVIKKDWRRSPVNPRYDPDLNTYTWDHGEYKDPTRYTRRSPCPPIDYQKGDLIRTEMMW